MMRIFLFSISIIFTLHVSTNCQVGIISSYDINDPYEGQMLLVHKKQSSSSLKDNSMVNYSCSNAFDGKLNTAWCVRGHGKEWIKLFIKERQYVQNKGMMNVYRIIINNGLTHSKKLYYANNRIKTIKAEFSEGETRILKFKDSILKPQKFRINIKAKWVKLIIIEVYKGKQYNDTCISEMWLETATHPSEMTNIQRKNWGYD